MIISQTPLRISLCGGGTDFKDYYEKNEGFVVSAAIDKYVFVIVKERFDNLIYVNYTKKEIVEHHSEIKHDLVREAALLSGLPVGVEITMLADIPSEGSGLGSSSSLTVGLLNAFYNFQGVQVTAERLASEASKIEIEILKKPIGKQDQYIAAFGGLSAIKFNRDDSIIVEKLDLESNVLRRLGSNLLLFYTNVTRKADLILEKQKENISKKLEFHHEIKKLAYDVRDSLMRGKIDSVGAILKKNWEYKKQLSDNISNGLIDEMYKKATESGILGGKVSGAGGGGFLLVYCKREKQDILREGMKEYRELPFMLEPYGSKIVFDYRRYDAK